MNLTRDPLLHGVTKKQNQERHLTCLWNKFKSHTELNLHVPLTRFKIPMSDTRGFRKSYIRCSSAIRTKVLPWPGKNTSTVLLYERCWNSWLSYLSSELPCSFTHSLQSLVQRSTRCSLLLSCCLRRQGEQHFKMSFAQQCCGVYGHPRQSQIDR